MSPSPPRSTTVADPGDTCRTVGWASGTVLIVLVALLGGCKELGGRTKVREGNSEFKASHFEAAVKDYQDALVEVDDPAIHYNLGLAYYRMFKPGSTTPENKALADKVAAELSIWVAANLTHPDATPTRDLITQTWMDAGSFDKAIAYWQEQLKAFPTNLEIMNKLASISLKGGMWKESIGWYNKVAIAAPDPTGRALAYQSIGNLAFSKLNSKSLMADDRIAVADIGTGALQRAIEIAPETIKNHWALAMIYNFRGITQGASWAIGIDRASMLDQIAVQNVLLAEAKKAAAAATPPGTPGAGSGAGFGTGSGSAAIPAPPGAPVPPTSSPAKAGG